MKSGQNLVADRGLNRNDTDAQSIQPYLLRPVLKVTALLGRNIVRRSVLMVPTSSKAKSNNIVVFG